MIGVALPKPIEKVIIYATAFQMAQKNETEHPFSVRAQRTQQKILPFSFCRDSARRRPDYSAIILVISSSRYRTSNDQDQDQASSPALERHVAAYYSLVKLFQPWTSARATCLPARLRPLEMDVSYTWGSRICGVRAGVPIRSQRTNSEGWKLRFF